MEQEGRRRRSAHVRHCWQPAPQAEQRRWPRRLRFHQASGVALDPCIETCGEKSRVVSLNGRAVPSKQRRTGLGLCIIQPHRPAGVSGDTECCVLKWVLSWAAAWRVYKGVNDWDSLVRGVTAEANAVADKRGRLPERIEVEANFDFDPSGCLVLSRSPTSPGLINIRMELAPQWRRQDSGSSQTTRRKELSGARKRTPGSVQTTLSCTEG